MNLEELAFVNQQVAGMLRSGIPLEGSLRQLCANMRRGVLREEFEALGTDLARGIPLGQALDARKLPEFYVQMLKLGAKANDMPGVLTMIADHYERANLIWHRLKGLLVYPAIVLTLALGLSALLATILTNTFDSAAEVLTASEWAVVQRGSQLSFLLTSMWVPTALLSLLLLSAAGVLLTPALRRRVRWWAPGFRESALANLGATMSLLLRSGSHFGDALDLVEKMEGRSPVHPVLRKWRNRLSEGGGNFSEMSGGGGVVPPLFCWLVAQGGEDLAKGFKRAGEIYHARAVYRIEMLLYSVLPISVLVLGLIILGQFYPLVRILTATLSALGDVGGFE
jgi:type IV pilus assembly protein PilC